MNLPRSLVPTVRKLVMLLCKCKSHTMGKRVLVMLARQRRRKTRRGPSPHKQRRPPLRVVMSQGAKPPVMTLRELLTLTIFYRLIIMVMFMQNILVHMMVTLLILFGFLRPLLLTKEDPLPNGDLKSRLDFM